MRFPIQVSLAIALLGSLGISSRLATQTPCCELVGRSIAEEYRIGAISERRFTHAELWELLNPYLGRGGVKVRELGQSVFGKAIRAVVFGQGPTRALLWSQMHGDESVATMALADMIHFFAAGGEDPLRTLIRDRLTVVMVPMLNPDGAERFQRRNAVGVDINRDARRLATPEGRILKSLRDSLEPAFGFNLHDQGARNTVGSEGLPVAIALLAPAADSTRSYGVVRDRARQLAAVLATGLERELPGRTAKYDDTFNPRAFGDLIQQWGTSTVLVESGSLPDDPQKQALRGINVMLLLTALEAIATERYEVADPDTYEELPFNRGVTSDILILGGQLVLPKGEPMRLDLTLVYEDPVARTGLRLGDVGDLADAVAMDTVDASGLYLHIVTPSTLDPADWWLIAREPIAVSIRRGPDSESAIVRRLPEH